MKRSLLALAALFAAALLAPAHAQIAEPICRPKPAGTGTYLQRGEVANVGRWFYWWCPRQFDHDLQIVFELQGFRLTHPDTSGMTMDQVFAAYWRANATIQLTDARAKPLVDAARAAALQSPPLKPVWVVAKNGTLPTRPAYPMVNGVRGTVSTARATVGATCNTALRSIDGTTVYAGVAPSLVAVCMRRP